MQNLKEKLLSTNLFINNKYLDDYIDLISKNITTEKIKYKTQRHHILQRKWFNIHNIPIDNSKENLVNLLYKDHILAHYYLCKCTLNELHTANIKTLINMTSLKYNYENVQYIISHLDSFQLDYEKLLLEHYCHKIEYEELFQFYIIENHTMKETAEHFNCDLSCIYRWLLRYNIQKTTKKYNYSSIDRATLYDLYIIKNYTIEKLSQIFNVSIGKIKYTLNEYNIKKGINTDHSNRKKITIKKEEFYNLYIIKNYSITDLCNLFKVSRFCIQKYLKEFNIKKTDKKLISEAIKKGKSKMEK